MHGPEQNGEKLIRHLIPEIALRQGQRMETRRVEGAEHAAFLRLKIKEEADELAAANPKTFVSELADVRQAIADFCSVAGIKLADLRFETQQAPTEPSELRIFFRSQIARLAKLAENIPYDESDVVDHMGDMLGTTYTLAETANIRENVRVEMSKKRDEKGGFVPGVVWKVDEGKTT